MFLLQEDTFVPKYLNYWSGVGILLFKEILAFY
jgi:hypothetical protein